MDWASDEEEIYQMSDHELLTRACIKIQEALIRGDSDLADTFLRLASERLLERYDY